MKPATLSSRLASFTGLATLSLLLTLAGCSSEESGSTPDENGSEPVAGSLDKLFTYPQIQSCGSCHGPDGSQSLGFDLSTQGQFRDQLVNKTQNDYPQWQEGSDESFSNQVTQECGASEAAPYVAPNMLNKSSLLEAVTYEYGERCAGTHAFHAAQNAMLTDPQIIEDLVLWIIEEGTQP